MKTDKLVEGETYVLFSEDYTMLEQPRTCSLHSFARSSGGNPLAILEVAPRVELDGVCHRRVLVAARHIDETVMRIIRWPLSVNISAIVNETADLSHVTAEDLYFFAIGHLDRPADQSGK